MEEDNEYSGGTDNPPRKPSFEVLYKKFYCRLVGFFRKRGLSPVDSEDLAQDSLMRAYRYYSDFRSDSSLETWLFKIAWNVWRNWLRHNSAGRRSGEVESFDGENNDAQASWGNDPDPTDGPLKQLLHSEEKAVVSEAISRLPNRMGECLQLYIHVGLSYAEISLFLGIHLNTVKSTISQGKQKLISDLKRQHPELFLDNENGGSDAR